MLALNHEKPYWMADFYASSQVFVSSIAQDAPIERTKDTTDWFGVEYKFSEAQGSNTPMGNVLNDITEWEEKIKWPDLSQFDWASDGAQLERDESLALYMRKQRLSVSMPLKGLTGPHRPHHRPEAVRAFLERLVDKIELFNCIRDQFAGLHHGGGRLGAARAPSSPGHL